MKLISDRLPDLDAIARNLAYLDLAHLNPEESAQYERELSVLAALNEALESSAATLKTSEPPDEFWQQLHVLLSDAAALVSSQIAPLLDLNAERSYEPSDCLAPQPQRLTLAASQPHCSLL